MKLKHILNGISVVVLGFVCFLTEEPKAYPTIYVKYYVNISRKNGWNRQDLQLFLLEKEGLLPKYKIHFHHFPSEKVYSKISSWALNGFIVISTSNHTMALGFVRKRRFLLVAF